MSDKTPVVVNEPKVNGFSKPLHNLQLVSWIVFAYLNLSFHAVYGCHTQAIFILFNLVHVLLAIATFTSAYSATNANVVDPYVKERGFPTATMKISEFKEVHAELIKRNEFFWCKHCNWYVSKHSKHCRACNRCTAHFDHHCRWLNNCVSRQNYNSFLAAVCMLASMLIYEIALGAMMLTTHVDISNHVFMAFTGYHVIYTLIAFHVFVATAILIPLSQLFVFHVFLYKKQITTYEWVMQRQEMRIEKIAKDAVKEQQKRSLMPHPNTGSMRKYIQQNIGESASSKAEKFCDVLRSYFNSLRECQCSINRVNVSQNNQVQDVPSDSEESAEIHWCTLCRKRQNVVHINNENEEMQLAEDTYTEKSVLNRPGDIQSGSPPQSKHTGSAVPSSTDIVIITDENRNIPLPDTVDEEEVAA